MASRLVPGLRARVPQLTISLHLRPVDGGNQLRVIYRPAFRPPQQKGVPARNVGLELQSLTVGRSKMRKGCERGLTLNQERAPSLAGHDVPRTIDPVGDPAFGDELGDVLELASASTGAGGGGGTHVLKACQRIQRHR